jgi:hypothetical protein
VLLEHLGRDEKPGLNVNDWVELVDDDIILLNKTVPLLQVREVDSMEGRVVLSWKNGVMVDPERHALLRRWDQKAMQGTIPIQLSGEGETLTDWIPLENGIEVQFALSRGARIRHGDYWLIPARAVTGDVEWPLVTDKEGKRQRRLLPPLGVAHHFAPLAILRVVENKVKSNTDCRCVFTHLSEDCKYNFLGRLGTESSCPEG